MRVYMTVCEQLQDDEWLEKLRCPCRRHLICVSVERIA